MTDRDACIALNMISGIGYVRFSALTDYFGSAGRAAERSVQEYASVPGISRALAEKLAAFRWQDMCEEEKRTADCAGVRILTLYDAAYPEVLKQLSDPPLCLYVRGVLPAFPCKALAVVGSRKMSRYGEEMTRAITTDAVCSGCVIVSGLAYGVDTVAHRTTVECGGRTIAVLGGGLMYIHPVDNIPLAQDILKRGGALVSEFPMACPAGRTTFPRRNRIIAALAEGLLVVEAGVKSGALLSAKAAAELGREVFAVPGQATNEQARGCHQLIREGACLTESFDDINGVLFNIRQPDLLPEGHFADGAVPQSSGGAFSDLDPVEAEILKYIDTQGVSLEQLETYTQMDTGELAAMLMRLEFKFLIRRGADMLYYRER